MQATTTSAPLPPNEAQRLEALQRYDIVGTPPEPAFDRIARLARRIFGVPIAFVSLVDHDRQWFKASHGVSEPFVPRDTSFCAHTIAGAQVLVVPDATQDERFARNPFVTGEAGTRFYAGAPLLSRDGHGLGTLAIFGPEPRVLSQDEIETLCDLAAEVSELLELRLEKREAQEEVEAIHACDLSRADQELRQSEERYRTLIQNLNEIVYLLENGEGSATPRVLLMNEQVQQVTGCSPQEFERDPELWLSLIHPEDAAGVRDLYTRLYETRQSQTGEYRLRHRESGEYRWIEDKAVPRLGEDGEVIGLWGLARDISERKQAEENRREADERLRLLESVVVTANDSILITEAEPIEGPGPRILYVNQAFTRATGYTLEDVLGKTPRILQGPDTDPEASAKIRSALKRWKPVQVELLNYRKDGTPFWVEISIVPVANEKGWYTHWVSVQRETTERRRSEAALREVQTRFERIAANVPGMVYQFVLHPDGSIDWPFVSEGCRDLYGVEPAFVQQNPNFLLDLLHPDDRVVFGQSIAASAATLEPWQWEGRFTHPAGREMWAQAAARPERLENGDVLWDGVTLDITPRKQAEAAMQAAKEEAEAARENAEAANRAKSEFLSRMSHELRTPLNAILGFAQLFEPESLSQDDRDSVEQILKAGRHLLELINEVLDISRIEAGRLSLSLEPVDVHGVVREVLDLAAPLASERQIKLQESVEAAACCVLADRQKLKQVLLNLVSNAVKYNSHGGRVEVSCREIESGIESEIGSEIEGGRLSIEVSDTGAGIAPDDLKRLFTPFERLGAEGSGIEGTGIGLALSKRLAEMMGGSISVRSVPGQGSTFCVELPRAQPIQQEAPAAEPGDVAAAGGRAGAQQTVLYIEDNLSNLKLIERVLSRRRGLRLVSAMQGGLGLELAREHRPDLILLDLHLPDMHGDEVLRRLRQDAVLAGTPVMVLSADATPQQVRRLLGLGADAYLTKPLNVPQFLQTLEEHLPEEHLPPASSAS